MVLEFARPLRRVVVPVVGRKKSSFAGFDKFRDDQADAATQHVDHTRSGEVDYPWQSRNLQEINGDTADGQDLWSATLLNLHTTSES